MFFGVHLRSKAHIIWRRRNSSWENHSFTKRIWGVRLGSLERKGRVLTVRDSMLSEAWKTVRRSRGSRSLPWVLIAWKKGIHLEGGFGRLKERDIPWPWETGRLRERGALRRGQSLKDSGVLVTTIVPCYFSGFLACVKKRGRRRITPPSNLYKPLCF